VAGVGVGVAVGGVAVAVVDVLIAGLPSDFAVPPPAASSSSSSSFSSINCALDANNSDGFTPNDFNFSRMSLHR